MFTLKINGISKAFWFSQDDSSKKIVTIFKIFEEYCT